VNCQQFVNACQRDWNLLVWSLSNESSQLIEQPIAFAGSSMPVFAGHPHFDSAVCLMLGIQQSVRFLSFSLLFFFLTSFFDLVLIWFLIGNQRWIMFD
jgi:hypothetical protein